jgi:hypothetical protein
MGVFRYEQTAFDRVLAPTNDKDLARVTKALTSTDQFGWTTLKRIIENETSSTPKGRPG